MSETLYFVNILDKDKMMDNVQEYNICDIFMVFPVSPGKYQGSSSNQTMFLQFI
jgi:hypothetical protein